MSSEKRMYRAAHGICTTCGKRPASEGYAQCEECRIKGRGYHCGLSPKQQASNEKIGNIIWERLRRDFSKDARVQE